MKKILSIILLIALVFTVQNVSFAEREYVGETLIKDNMLFINGSSVSAAQLPNEFMYVPVEHLEYYGFDVLYSDDKGYKEYVITRNEKNHFVPEYTYNAEHYKNYKKVYTTDAKVYLDSDIPANVFELENGTVLVQSDELAKYGTYNWDAAAHTVSIDFERTDTQPEGQPFHSVLGINDIEEIGSAVIVRNDGKCADIASEDLQKWLNTYWNFAPFDRVVGPYDSSVYREFYIKLWTKDKTKSFIVYPDSGVVVGGYGEPCESHGETKKNYIWYLPYIGNARNALNTANNELVMKYIVEQSKEFAGVLRDATDDDKEVLPDNNLLITDGASDWSKSEIQKAAACNLLPYELADKYQKSITRKEFCYLIYRLIATEFSPYSDSRMGESSAIDDLRYERHLSDDENSVYFSDCDDFKVKFLSDAGIINGMGDGTFLPDASLTREQAATILYRTAEFLKNKTITGPHDVIYYYDEANISDWAIEAVKIMKDMGIMKGVSESGFAPKGTYTVEQAIATILRLYECF